MGDDGGTGGPPRLPVTGRGPGMGVPGRSTGVPGRSVEVPDLSLGENTLRRTAPICRSPRPGRAPPAVRNAEALRPPNEIRGSDRIFGRRPLSVDGWVLTIRPGQAYLRAIGCHDEDGIGRPPRPSFGITSVNPPANREDLYEQVPNARSRHLSVPRVHVCDVRPTQHEH